MEFEFTEEQGMVQREVRKFIESELTEEDRQHGDSPMTPELAKGLLKRLIPWGYIGPDQPTDPIIEGILFEEMGRVFPSLAGLAFIANGAARYVAQGAHPDVKARLANDLLMGERIGCMGISEPNVGSDPTGVECRAELKGDRYIINGNKIWISNGHIADVAIVICQTDKSKGPLGFQAILVDRKETPFESRDIETVGLAAFPNSELSFHDLEVPASNRLGGWETDNQESLLLKKKESTKGIPFNFNSARVMCASISCGIASKALEEAIEYAKVRKQFGKEIGRFQLVQALLADMAMDIEAARLLTFRARQKMSRGHADKEVSIAKAFATEMGVRVTNKAMEVMGALGLTREAGMEKRMRDARMWVVPDGTSQIQRLIIGKELTGFTATRG